MSEQETLFRKEALEHYASDLAGDVRLPPVPRWTQMAFWLVIILLIAAVTTMAVLRPRELLQLWPGLARLFGEAVR